MLKLPAQYPTEEEPLYRLLRTQLRALTQDVPYLTANLANAAALLNAALEDINWVGFYLLDGDALILGPFQGKPACIRIPVGNGVCGAAVAQNSLQRVADVAAFPGHIACDSASRSEIVVPLRKNGVPVAVLDIDSPILDRFSAKDVRGLESLAQILEKLF